MIRLLWVFSFLLVVQLAACSSIGTHSQRKPGSVSGITEKCQIGDTPAFPNFDFTPGVVNSDTTKDQICTPGFTAQERAGKLKGDDSDGSDAGKDEHSMGVTSKEKKDVFIKYFGKVPANPGDYEIDHFISLQLGGSNDIRNLWPQLYCPFPGAKEKDVVETTLKDWICDGSISMQDAQRIITGNWYDCYKEIKANNKCSVPDAANFKTVNDSSEIRAYP